MSKKRIAVLLISIICISLITGINLLYADNISKKNISPMYDVYCPISGSNHTPLTDPGHKYIVRTLYNGTYHNTQHNECLCGSEIYWIPYYNSISGYYYPSNIIDWYLDPLNRTVIEVDEIYTTSSNPPGWKFD